MDTRELGKTDRTARSGGPGSSESILRRWTLSEASAPAFGFSRLLPGGQAQITVLDMPRLSHRRAARHLGTGGPEPEVGLGEEGGSVGLSRAMHHLHLHAPCSARMPGEEIGDMTTGDPCLRHHAT